MYNITYKYYVKTDFEKKEYNSYRSSTLTQLKRLRFLRKNNK